MSLLRSARFPAIVLLVAAALGLIVANSAVGPAVDDFMHAERRHPRRLRALDRRTGSRTACSRSSSSSSPSSCSSSSRRAAQLGAQGAAARDRRGRRRARADRDLPRDRAAASDAAGGLADPDGHRHRVRARRARGLRQGPARGLRIFLLALAILDDIVGIVFIAVLFTDRRRTSGCSPAAVVAVIALRRPEPAARHAAPACRSRSCSSLLAIADVGARVRCRACTRRSPASRSGSRWRSSRRCASGTRSSRGSTCIVLPLFAFSAALVAIPAVLARRALARRSGACWSRCRSARSSASRLFGWLVAAHRQARALRRRSPSPTSLAAGALGGIGFTVSLLLSELAFADAARDPRSGDPRRARRLGDLAHRSPAILVSLRAAGITGGERRRGP